MSFLIRSSEGTAPILLEMPHSGRTGLQTRDGVPAAIASRLRLESGAVRQTIGFGVDAAVPEMSGYYDLLDLLDLSGIRNELARVFTDTNRSADEVSGWAVAGYEENKHNHGVIWARTIPTDVDLTLPSASLESIVRERCERMLTTPLSGAEYASLLLGHYLPYHELIRKHHDRILSLHGRCVHLALHSLPAVAVGMVDGGYVNGPRAARGPFDLLHNTLPDVILIHNGYAAADEKYVHAVRRVFESAGLIVQDGQGPFLGDKGVTKLYGDPARGVHVIGIEHVAHEAEPRRHLGDPFVDVAKARRFQAVYWDAVRSLLAL